LAGKCQLEVDGILTWTRRREDQGRGAHTRERWEDVGVIDGMGERTGAKGSGMQPAISSRTPPIRYRADFLALSPLDVIGRYTASPISPQHRLSQVVQPFDSAFPERPHLEAADSDAEASTQVEKVSNHLACARGTRA
jgi:hypothetical protein